MSTSTMDTTPMIALERVTVDYGKQRAVDDVSFAVPAGAVFALLGRNGSGKSSLVRCLLGQQRPTAGSVSVFGDAIWNHRTQAMAKVGVVPEEPDAPPEMNGAQLARFCSGLYPRWDGASVDDRLTRFGVPRDVPFGRLSKGQKGQLGLALALAPHPELLVLDDPTLGLDVIARKAFSEELIAELADRGTTVFLTTHDLAGIEGIATHVAILKSGKLVLADELETLKGRFRRLRYGRRLIAADDGAAGELAGFAPLNVAGHAWGIEAVIADYTDIAFERFRAHAAVTDADAAAMSLEEIFLAVVGEEPGGVK